MMEVMRVDERNREVVEVPRLGQVVFWRTMHVLFTCEGKWWLALQSVGRKHAGEWGATAATFYRRMESFDRALERVCKDELGYEVFVNRDGIYARDPFFQYEGTFLRRRREDAVQERDTFVDIVTREIHPDWMPEIGRPEQTERLALWNPAQIVDPKAPLAITPSLRRVAAMLLTPASPPRAGSDSPGG